jgi:hypothetical protein
MIHGATGHESGCVGVGTELVCGDGLHAATGSPRMVNLHGDVHSMHVSTVHCGLGGACVLLSPELDTAGIGPEASWGADGGQGAKRVKELKEIGVEEVGWELFYETREGRGWWEGCRRVCWWVGGQDEGNGWQKARDGSSLESGESLFGCKEQITSESSEM